jgi:2-keto-3-deoxy-L-rhamnonate aldolase RhmA
MQHATLEWHIQHAADIGALGVIVPTVDDVDRAREAAKWAICPPMGRRGSGAAQAARLWGINGIDYHDTINDNMLVVVMIETPAGVANAFDIASVRGLDVANRRQQRSESILRLFAERQRSLP